LKEDDDSGSKYKNFPAKTATNGFMNKAAAFVGTQLHIPPSRRERRTGMMVRTIY
jgi:hypothetical protein